MISDTGDAMNLMLPTDVPAKYKSPSRIAQWQAESWILREIECPACRRRLEQVRVNMPVLDFVCPLCGGGYELKSQGVPVFQNDGWRGVCNDGSQNYRGRCAIFLFYVARYGTRAFFFLRRRRILWCLRWCRRVGLWAGNASGKVAGVYDSAE